MDCTVEFHGSNPQPWTGLWLWVRTTWTGGISLFPCIHIIIINSSPLSNESALYIQPRCMKRGRWYLQAVVVARQPKRGIKLKCVHRNIACSTYICASYQTIEYSRACITFIGLVTGGHIQPPPPISSPVVCLALYRHSWHAWRIAVWLLCKQLH